MTLLDGEHAEAAVAAHVAPAGVDVATTVHVDDELGVCVLSLTATGAMCGRRLDDLAIDVFAACVVEDLVQTVVGESAS